MTVEKKVSDMGPIEGKPLGGGTEEEVLDDNGLGRKIAEGIRG